MFSCNQCDKSFDSYRGLNGHMRVHGPLKGSYSPPRQQKSLHQFRCLNCDKKGTYSLNNRYGLYCSNKCQGEYEWETVYKPKILRGETRGPSILKKYLTEEFGYKCSVCEIFDWQGKKLVLRLDHIDGNSDNNLPNNLRLICPNCDSQTDTFTGRNIKNTKRNRYLQRYKSQKKQKGR